jgi:cytochrome c oxidase cbb3-type subunit 2
MNHIALIVLGVFISLGTSWFGLYVVPSSQYLSMDVVETQEGFYPVKPDPMIERGRELYTENGCVYCHTQHVRPAGFGTDIERGFGTRRTTAQDYVGQSPALVGQLRIGPDLTNLASRREKDWLVLHLYNPRIHSPESNMPSYSYMFNEVEYIEGIPAGEEGLDISTDFKPGANYSVTPTPELNALVTYLTSLKAADSLTEAK